MTRVPNGTRLALAAMAATALATTAHAQERRKQISPYIEAGQVLTADLQSNDVLTYTTVAAGVDASIQTRRVQVTAGYRYEHQFSHDKNVGDSDIHSGLARAGVTVAPGFGIEAGAIATRARADIRGDAPANLTGNASNTSQVYSAYAGPSLSGHAGPVAATVGYRYGYTKVEAPDVTGVDPTQAPLDVYDASHSHSASASLSTKSGTLLPVGVTIATGYEKEKAGQLDQQFESKHVRGDVVLPVGRGVALKAGGGYERLNITQKDALRDPVTNEPVRDAAGRFVTDPASPDRTAYKFAGEYWDAGVIYRPNRRMMLQAQIGRRYDSWSYTGSLSWQPTSRSALGVNVYDQVQSFGRQLRDGIALLPTSFTSVVDPFSDQYSGCVYGAGGSAGGCLNGVFQSINTSNYRARGIDAVYALNFGRLRIGMGGGYSNRRFFAPDTGAGFSVDGVEDESFYGQFNASRALTSRSSMSGAIVANYSQSGINGAPSVFGAGATGGYNHSFGALSTSASLGLYYFNIEGVDTDVSAQARLGLRYGF